MSIFHRRSPSPAHPAAHSIQQANAAQRPPQPAARDEAHGHEHHGLLDRVRNFIHPERTLTPCPTPERPMAVEAAVERVRQTRPAGAYGRLFAGLDDMSLQRTLRAARDDVHRAVIVEELVRLHPGAWPRPASWLDFDASAAWVERFTKVSPALAHDLVSHVVRLVPDSMQRRNAHRVFDALKDIRDPDERAAVVEQITRFPGERRGNLEELIKVVTDLKETHRGPTLQCARDFGWDGRAELGWPEAIHALDKVPHKERDELRQAVRAVPQGQGGHLVHALADVSHGHRVAVAGAFATAFPNGVRGDQLMNVMHALGKVKKDLPSVAACAAHLCPEAMNGKDMAKVIGAIRRLPASHRDAVVLLVRNIAPESSDVDELIDLLEELEHIHEDDVDCLPLVSQLAMQHMDADDLFRAIHAMTRVPKKRRSAVVHAATQLCGGDGNTNRQDWPRILKELAKVDGNLAEVAAEARQLCPDSMPGVQRVHILATLAGTPDRDERAEFVRLGEMLQRDSEAYWTSLHPLSQLARTPATERSGVVTNLLRLCPPGTSARDAMASVMQTLRWVERTQRADFTTQLLRLLGATDRPSSAYVSELADIFAPLQPTQRRELADYVLTIMPDGGSPASRERVIFALVRVPEYERVALTVSCAPLRTMQPASRALSAVEAVVNTRPSWRATQALSLVENDVDLLDLLTHSLPAGHRGARGAASRTDTARYYAARQRENVMDARLIARIGESWKQLKRHYPQAPVRGSQLARVEAWLATYPTSAEATDAQKAVFCRVRGGATEIRNALRVINDGQRLGDYSGALRANNVFRMEGANAGIGDMFERIWFAIESYSDATKTPAEVEHEKNLMRYSAFIALSQCVEDDGHRVCSYGFLERSFIILQGRVPGVFIDDEVPKVTPQQMVTFVTERLSDQCGDREPSLRELRTFFNDNVKAARDLYGANSSAAQIVEEHLNGYLDYTYETWQHSRHEADPQLNAWRAAIRERRNSARGEVQ